MQDNMMASHTSHAQHTAPRRIAFFLFPGVEEQDFVGPWECFGMWRLEAQGPEILTVASTTETLRCAHGLMVKPEYSCATCPPFEALVIPGGKGRRDVLTCERSRSFLTASCQSTRDILTVCTGSLILSALQVLDGRRATTHWEFLGELKQNSAVAKRRRILTAVLRAAKIIDAKRDHGDQEWSPSQCATRGREGGHS